MKANLLILAAASIFLAGCGDSSKPGTTANTVSNVVTAPLDYIGAVGQAQKHAESVIDVASLNNAIQQFNAGEGHFPKTLQEMVPTYIAKIPEAPFGSKIVYDPTSGTVKVVKQ